MLSSFPQLIQTMLWTVKFASDRTRPRGRDMDMSIQWGGRFQPSFYRSGPPIFSPGPGSSRHRL